MTQPSYEFMQEFTEEIAKNYAKLKGKFEIEKILTLNQLETEKLIEKIETIIKEQGFQALECPGPRRFLIIKKNNKLLLSKISLDELEIQELVKSFLNTQKIDEKVFKIKRNNLTISGIISESAGSRFLIIKS